MTDKPDTLIPAAELALNNAIRIPGESDAYRVARRALLAEEIELRRKNEAVAAQRRALPPGAAVGAGYRFEGEDGPTDLAGLFEDMETLGIYSYMFGPQRARPCPMCSSLLSAWEGNMADIGRHMSLAVVARSPIDKLIAWKKERGWKALRLYSDVTGDYSRDYFAVEPDGGESGVFNVFTRRDGTIRHFWMDEMTGPTADPGQDPRGVSEWPLWSLLDQTPGGRPADWYPSLDYKA